MDYVFEPRWKEELVCSCDEGRLVFELTMGTLTVYLPTRDKWAGSAPEWAKPLYDEIHDALEVWAKSQAIPLVIDGSAAVTLDDRP